MLPAPKFREIELREHIARMYRLFVCLRLDNVMACAGSAHWGHIEHNLHLAQGLRAVSSDTSFFDPQSGHWCGGWGLLDGLNSELADDLMLASIRFTLLWTAFECYVKTQGFEQENVEDPKQRGGGARKSKDVNTVRGMMSSLDTKLELPPRLREYRDSAVAACKLIGDMDDWLISLSKNKIGSKGENTFSYCAELVRTFRNHVAHGNENMPWPDNDAMHAQRRDVAQQAVVDRHVHMSRILLMLIQTCLACDIDEGIMARAGYDEDYEEVHMPLRQFITEAHTVGCGTEIDLRYYDGPSIE